MPRPALACVLAASLGLAFAGPAAADARQDMHAAFLKNMAAKTYRATMTEPASGKPISTVEFQAPDRFRISVGGQPPSVIAGGNMYIQAGGRAMKIPVPAGMLQNYRSDAAWKEMEHDTLIRDAGLGVVGAEPARKYHWITTGKNASTGDAWVSVKSGRVIQVETVAKPGSKHGAVRVRYSDFDNPAIRISPPN